MGQYYKPKVDSEETFFLKFDNFIIHTIKILRNESVCPKSARWLGADEIISIAQRLHTVVHLANNIKVTNIEEKERRHALQTEGYALMMTLGEKMTFCSKIYSIDADKLSTWLEYKGKSQWWLNGWMKSDEKRYADIQRSE